MMTLGLMPEAWVGHCFRQQQRIAEFVADAFFERCHIPFILSELADYYSWLMQDKARERQPDAKKTSPRKQCALSALINFKRSDHIQCSLQNWVVRRRLFRCPA